MLPGEQSTPANSPATGNTEQTRPENRAFYPALDGVRTFAFVLVFLQHYNEMPWGWAGVDLFFVLSGFLITGILFDTRDDPFRVRNFYVRRTLRIFPLYYGVMFAILLFWPMVRWQFTWAWLCWPFYVGNLTVYAHPFVLGTPGEWLFNGQPTGTFGGHVVRLNLGHFWSLCVEEQFYLLWPWVVFWIKDRRKLMWICAAMLPLTLLLRVVASRELPVWMMEKSVLYRATPFRLDALLLGGLLALLLRGRAAQKMLKGARWALPVAIALLVACVAFVPGAQVWRQGYDYPGWAFTWGLTMVDLLASLVILAALQPGTVVYRFFNLKLLRWMGRLTYGAYIFHDIPHHVLRLWVGKHFPGHPTRTTMMLAFVLTFVAAWLSFQFLESPFLNLKERWTRRPELAA